MSRQTIIMTGCDANFYDFMSETLASIEALHLPDEADVGILDLGLMPEQVEALKAKGYTVRQPGWTLNVPQELRKTYLVGFDARTCLRDYFPGYRVYLWFDADAWAQTREFYDSMVAGTLQTGAAIIRENGSGYHRDLMYNRWWYGHMLAAYGLLHGIKVARLPAINAGIYALRDDAPHWNIWRHEYQFMIDRRHKLNMDQHAFNSAFVLHDLPHWLSPATCNWICTLSPPRWDAGARRFVTPDPAAKPLSVLHLAGPDKRRTYQLRTTDGGVISTPVTYEAYKSLTEK